MIKFMISDYVFDAWLYAAYENNFAEIHFVEWQT